MAEKEAEAAVAAARAAACQQQEQALQRCNAEWTDRLGKSSSYTSKVSTSQPSMNPNYCCIQSAIYM